MRISLLFFKSFGVHIHPRKVVSYVPDFWLPLPSHWIKCNILMLMGQLKVLLVYLVVGLFLEIIMLPLWIISLH